MLFSAVFKEHELARIAVLAGVAHDIAHHAASALGYLSPHLALSVAKSGAQAGSHADDTSVVAQRRSGKNRRCGKHLATLVAPRQMTL